MYSEAENHLDVEANIDTRGMGGHSLVWFIEIYDKDYTRKIVEHTDLMDEKETLHVKDIGIHTVLSDDGGNKEVSPGQINLVDAVSISNVSVGCEYVLESQLLDKESEQVIANSSTSFIADMENCEKSVTFSVDTSNLVGHDIVCYETLKMGDVIVADHSALNDQDQTIHVKTPQEEKVADTLSNLPKTKDLAPWVALAIVAAGGALGYGLSRGRRFDLDTSNKEK